MNRRTMLKSILVIPFLPKLLRGQTKKSTNLEAINPNYENTAANNSTKVVFYCGNDTLLEGQYVIYTPHVAWIPEDITHIWKEIRKAKSYKDLMESIDYNTFAGVAKNPKQGPGFVEIYTPKLKD